MKIGKLLWWIDWLIDFEMIKFGTKKYASIKTITADIGCNSFSYHSTFNFNKCTPALKKTGSFSTQNGMSTSAVSQTSKEYDYRCKTNKTTSIIELLHTWARLKSQGESLISKKKKNTFRRTAWQADKIARLGWDPVAELIFQIFMSGWHFFLKLSETRQAVVLPTRIWINEKNYCLKYFFFWKEFYFHSNILKTFL